MTRIVCKTHVNLCRSRASAAVPPKPLIKLPAREHIEIAAAASSPVAVEWAQLCCRHFGNRSIEENVYKIPEN